jgi:hypothetical protein
MKHAVEIHKLNLNEAEGTCNERSFIVVHDVWGGCWRFKDGTDKFSRGERVSILRAIHSKLPPTRYSSWETV